MNHLNILAAFGLALILATGCREIEPTITPCQTNRVVLVEEFTGIDCSSCPIGSSKLEQVSAQNPGKVIIVGIHAGKFAINHNGFDLKCADGLALEQHLGPVGSYPSAVVNRKLFDEENELPTIPYTKWAGLINQEICQPPIAELQMTKIYDPVTRSVSVTVDVSKGLFFSGNVEHNLAVTVMITEDDIIGYQNDIGALSFSNYNHKHVLRGIINNDHKGDVIIEAGGTITNQQLVISDYRIPTDWNVDNCHIIAFVHNRSTHNLEIHQAIEADLIQ